MTIRAPSFANASAVARPIPLLPPVTRAIFPANFCDMVFSPPNLRMLFGECSMPSIEVPGSVHSDLRHTSIDEQFDAGDVAAVIRREELDCLRDFVRCSHTPHVNSVKPSTPLYPLRSNVV